MVVVAVVELIDLSNLEMTSFLRSNNNNEILIGKNDKMINNETSPTVRWFYEQCLVIPETELRQFRCICRGLFHLKIKL